MTDTITLTDQIIRAYAKLATAQRDLISAGADQEQAHRELRTAIRAGQTEAQRAELADAADFADEQLTAAVAAEDAARDALTPLVEAQHLPVETTFDMVCDDIAKQL